LPSSFFNCHFGRVIYFAFGYKIKYPSTIIYLGGDFNCPRIDWISGGLSRLTESYVATVFHEKLIAVLQDFLLRSDCDISSKRNKQTGSVLCPPIPALFNIVVLPLDSAIMKLSLLIFPYTSIAINSMHTKFLTSVICM